MAITSQGPGQGHVAARPDRPPDCKRELDPTLAGFLLRNGGRCDGKAVRDDRDR